MNPAFRSIRITARLSAAAVTGVLLAALSACGTSPGGGASGSGGDASIQVGVFPISTYLPDQVAAKEGFFKKNGLSVQLVGPAMTGATAYQLMTTDKLQSYFNDVETTTEAITKGSQIKIGACVAPRSIYVIVANASAGLPSSGSFQQKIQALKGKRIGVTALGAGTDVGLSVSLQAAGVPASEVTRLAVGPPTSAVSQLKAGRIDAYITGSDSGAYQITASDPQTRVYASLGDSSTPDPARIFASGGWAVSAQWASQHPEQLDSYRKSLQQAIAWIKVNPAKAAKIMSVTMFAGGQLDVATRSVAAYITEYISSDSALTCARSELSATFGVFSQLRLGPEKDLNYDAVTAPAARATH